MKTPALITTPFPTFDEMADSFGMSLKRRAELKQIADSAVDRYYARQARASKSKAKARQPSGLKKKAA